MTSASDPANQNKSVNATHHLPGYFTFSAPYLDLPLLSRSAQTYVDYTRTYQEVRDHVHRQKHRSLQGVS